MFNKENGRNAHGTSKSSKLFLKRLSEIFFESFLAFLKGHYNMFIGGKFKERFIVSCTEAEIDPVWQIR